MNIQDKFKVQFDQVQQDFSNTVIGRTLIMDGDAACYKATADAKKLETAQRRFTTAIYEAMFLTGAETARVHLTPKGCYKNGRHLLLGAKPYQGNRQNKPKPPLLEVLRDTAPSLFQPHEDVQVFAQRVVEADDAIMQDAYSVEKAVVWSEDKDLQIVPCRRYCMETGTVIRLDEGDRYGWIKESHTPAGALRIKGHGTKFFWTQMLMGDTADNVKGIIKYDGKLCGPAAAFRELQYVTSEDHAANLVINGYRAINQNPIAEGEALWLTRCDGDSFVHYVLSLELTDKNRDFLMDCYGRKWKMTQDEYDEINGVNHVATD